MVTPREERRVKEMERLAAQLRELKAERDRLASQGAQNGESKVGIADESYREAKLSGGDNGKVVDKGKKSGEGKEMMFGLHGEKSRFLSVSSVDSKEYFPRVLPVVGPLETLSSEEYRGVRGVSSTTEKGQISIATLGEGGVRGDVVAIPGVEVVALAKDPVAVVVGSVGALGLQYDGKERGEKGPAALVVVERDVGNVKWKDRGFYLWKVEGEDVVKFGWTKRDLKGEDGVECLGEVLLCFMEVPKRVRAESTCWQEVEEVW